jgi:alpha-L-fucosidase 2
MNRNLLLILVIIALTGCRSRQDLQLWYDRPAGIWEATLPLGNGRLGMMPDGNPSAENIVLNEITLWSGSVQDPTNPTAREYLPQIRQFLLEGRNNLAQELMYEHFVCGGVGSGYGSGADVPFGCYQVLGNLHLQFSGNDIRDASYQRSLDLKKALARTEFNGQVREYFTSFADDVGIIRITSKKKTRVVIHMDRPERFTTTVENDRLVMRGTMNSGVEGIRGMPYVSKVAVSSKKGSVVFAGDSIVLDNIKKATLVFSAATGYFSDHPEQQCDTLLQNALNKRYRRLRKDHVRAYRQLFDRVSLQLGQVKDPPDIPTDERLQASGTKDDPGLDALYYQYGRYLLISSTRPGQLPPNLQGLWANTVQTPWNGDYHLNINLQMNHWLAEPANLAELHTPLIDFTKAIVPSGANTARSFYGAGGWTAHVICNPWYFTAPGEHPSWGATNTGGAWLCQHLWTHYLYNPNEEYLQEIYPVMKGACEFFLSSMIRELSHGWLVTAPTTSPENAFYMPDGKTVASVCMGSTMDNQLVRELFTNTFRAAEMLGVDSGFRLQLQKAVLDLPPHQVSPEGYLQEWLEDYRETEPHHRHVSHLYGLHPGVQISPETTPELARACEKTLERRGDGGTGWSRAWKINFWARLHNGERAYKLLKNLLSPESTYPNLFCAHPPFQIDGNFGGASGITEMLLQSHQGTIHLLPAVPKAWSGGLFRGMKVQGNAQISCRWKNGKVRKVKLESACGGTYNLEANGERVSVTLKPGEKIRLRFPLKKKKAEQE